MDESFGYLQNLLIADKLNRREFLKGATALGISAVAAQSLFTGSAQAAPMKGGRLRVGLAQGGTTDSLDPQTYTDGFMISVGFATHNTLTEINPDGELVGDIAESWEASADAATWRFNLRKGVEFSNGKPLTTDDVIASINFHRGKDSKSGGKSNVEPIASIETDGPNTVVFKLNSSNADFPYLMVDYHLLIMPAIDGKVDWENFIGTGGYILESFEPGVRAFLKRNPNYWKTDRAHFDEVELNVIADFNARQTALVNKQVDVISRCDLKTVNMLAKRPAVKIEETTGFLHFTIPMITSIAPFDNNDVRLALKYAIDRELLMQQVLHGHGSMGNDHPIAPSVPFYAELEQRTYDPDKAKFHLKKAGFDKLTLDLSTAEKVHSGAVDTAVLIKESAAKANIEINVKREPNDGYWSNVWMKKPWSICYWGGRPTCDWMFSQAYAEGANYNDTFWSNERFNKLLLQGRSELDKTKRIEIYREMQKILRDEGGVVVWAFANYVFALSDKVQHGPHLAGNWDLDGFRYLERWWFG